VYSIIDEESLGLLEGRLVGPTGRESGLFPDIRGSRGGLYFVHCEIGFLNPGS
jgi:hypothetical protein